MTVSATDALVRQAAFAFLDELRAVHGDVVPWKPLLRGFDFRGRRVPLVSQQGIFKPAVLELVPLSIRTTPPKPGQPAPYTDEMSEDGFLEYCYRGTDPEHRENRGLRAAWQHSCPLAYLRGVEPGWYAPLYPALIVADHRESLRFTVAVDAAAGSLPGASPADSVADVMRRYVTRDAVTRVHQAEFRHRVLRAYRERCSVCTLRHTELLDAAHIIPDREPGGEPVVPNGLALCKLHHAAYDSDVLGIRPDMVIEVREDVLREVDGPMLRHGLQATHGKSLVLPRRRADRPDERRLEVRYARFRDAG